MELAERMGILYGEGGLYDKLNHVIDWVDKTDGLNMNGEWKLDVQKKYTLEEIFDRQIRGWPYSGGKSLKDLREKGYHRVPEAAEGVLSLLLLAGQQDAAPLSTSWASRRWGTVCRADLLEAQPLLPHDQGHGICL